MWRGIVTKKNKERVQQAKVASRNATKFIASLPRVITIDDEEFDISDVGFDVTVDWVPIFHARMYFLKGKLEAKEATEIYIQFFTDPHSEEVIPWPYDDGGEEFYRTAYYRSKGEKDE